MQLRGHLLAILITASLCLLSAAMPSAAAGAAPLDKAEVEAWADATFKPALDARRYSGLVIAVVQGDGLLFAKGYGHADLAQRIPVDPAVTRFRIGSTTKTFTAMAIAQLLETQAIRSLDDPAARYLRRVDLGQSPESRITLGQLLTHTAGFDSAIANLGAKKAPALPLGAPELAGFRLPVVRPPGELSVYSNYSIALLGTIVEDVTGQALHEYLAEQIFAPLGMHDTTLNVSARPSPHLAVPSAFLPSGQAQEVPYLGVHPFYAAAGAIESTATDMAKYMIANLAQGRGPSAAVLSPAGFQRLHARAFGNHPATSGFGMAFMTLDWNGTRFVGHGGDWPGFHSIMLFSPAEQVGFFVSCLCESPQVGLVEQLTGSERLQADPAHAVQAPLTNVGIATAFLSRFWGAPVPPTGPGGSELAKFTGTYWHEYRNHRGIEKLLELFGGPSSTLVVEQESAATLRINGVGGYRETAPGVFWTADTTADLSRMFWESPMWAFTLDASGKPRSASPTFGLDPYLKVGSLLNPRVAAQAGALGLLVCCTGLLALFWPAASRSARLGRLLPVGIVCAVVGMAPVLLAGYAEGDGLAFYLLRGDRARLLGLVLLAHGIALAAIAMAVLAVLAWRRRDWGEGPRGVARRVHYTLLAIAALGLTGVAAFFNLLGAPLP